MEIGKVFESIDKLKEEIKILEVQIEKKEEKIKEIQRVVVNYIGP